MIINYLRFLSILGLLFISGYMLSCVSDENHNKNKTMLTSLSSNYTHVDFVNKVKENKDNNHLVWESIYNGAGVGVGDVNNDGLLDIYFCGNMSHDKLYINKGNLQFEDITLSAGIDEPSWSSGVNMTDINNDGLVDIYVSKMSWEKDMDKIHHRKNKLYINLGNSKFKEAADEYGIADTGHTTQASFFDYNHDGLLDLYVMNAPSHRYDQKLLYMKDNMIPYEFKDHFYINKGDHFLDITNSTIGNQQHAFGLGLSTVDINQDGWTDIYVANDFEKPDLLLINDQNGGFNNELTDRLKHISYSSMGMDIADINNDGYSDIMVLDMQSNDHIRSKINMPSMDIRQFWKNVGQGYYFQYMSNMLQLNTGTGKYSEIAQFAGLASTDWSWSVLLTDIDNDSYRDVLITNGINRNIKDNDFNVMMEKSKDENVGLFEMSKRTKVEKIENFVFQNESGSLKFVDKSKEWGFDHNGFSFGAAYGDLDNDGDIDVIVNNSNEKASIYENKNLDNNHSIRIQTMDGKSVLLNSTATIYYDDKKQISELHNIRGYQSCSESIMHFGLGSTKVVDSLVVMFPDGKRYVIHQPQVDSLYRIDINLANASSIKRDGFSGNKLVVELTDSGLAHRHRENRYNDFLKQVLIPHMETKNGPFASVSDINNDHLDDVYIGGAKGQSGSLSIQLSNISFESRTLNVFMDDNKYEDMGSAFFDVDNDGDKDLYVVSGGSEDLENTDIYIDRLYINDGNGNFSKAAIDLPRSNGSIVTPIDINKDGYTDLFIGGRMEGLKYPYPGTSHILINKKGVLVEDDSFKYKKMGMVTSASVLDFNKDGWEDIVIVGEWMQPQFLLNKEGSLENVTDDWLPTSNVGWWFDIKIADIDGDGIEELLLGNIGMNNKFKATNEKPLKVYSADFDKNNSNDIVLAKQTEYGEVPVRGKECSSEQLPYLNRKFKTFDEFAHANVNTILGERNISEALILEATNFESGYLKLVKNIDNSKSHYEFHAFPNLAQISSVQGIEVLDVNDDENQDVVIVGNLFDAEIETVRHDASFGLVMIGSGDGTFNVLQPWESGFEAGVNAKDIVKLKLGSNQVLVVCNNNYWTQLFSVN